MPGTRTNAAGKRPPKGTAARPRQTAFRFSPATHERLTRLVARYSTPLTTATVAAVVELAIRKLDELPE